MLKRMLNVIALILFICGGFLIYFAAAIISYIITGRSRHQDWGEAYKKWVDRQLYFYQELALVIEVIERTCRNFQTVGFKNKYRKNAFKQLLTC